MGTSYALVLLYFRALADGPGQGKGRVRPPAAQTHALDGKVTPAMNDGRNGRIGSADFYNALTTFHGVDHGRQQALHPLEQLATGGAAPSSAIGGGSYCGDAGSGAGTELWHT